MYQETQGAEGGAQPGADANEGGAEDVEFEEVTEEEKK